MIFIKEHASDEEKEEKEELTTFYIGTHSGKSGQNPRYKMERIFEVTMTRQKAYKLHRAMGEIFAYLTSGHCVRQVDDTP